MSNNKLQRMEDAMDRELDQMEESGASQEDIYEAQRGFARELRDAESDEYYDE